MTKPHASAEVDHTNCQVTPSTGTNSNTSPLNLSSATNTTAESRTFHYLHPDCRDDIFDKKEPKQSPLALLAQACNNIGKDVLGSSHPPSAFTRHVSRDAFGPRPQFPSVTAVRSADDSFPPPTHLRVYPPSASFMQDSLLSGSPATTATSAPAANICKSGSNKRAASSGDNVTSKRVKKSTTASRNAPGSRAAAGPPLSAASILSTSTPNRTGNEEKDSKNVTPASKFSAFFPPSSTEEDMLSSSCGRSTVTPDVSPTEFSHHVDTLPKWGSSKLREAPGDAFMEFLEQQKKLQQSPATSSLEGFNIWMNWLLTHQQQVAAQQSAAAAEQNPSSLLAMWQKMTTLMPSMTPETFLATLAASQLAPNTKVPTSIPSTPAMATSLPHLLSGFFPSTGVSSTAPVLPSLPDPASLHQFLTRASPAIISKPSQPVHQQPEVQHQSQQGDGRDRCSSSSLSNNTELSHNGDSPSVPTPGSVQFCMFCGRHCATLQDWVAHVKSHDTPSVVPPVTAPADSLSGSVPWSLSLPFSYPQFSSLNNAVPEHPNFSLYGSSPLFPSIPASQPSLLHANPFLPTVNDVFNKLRAPELSLPTPTTEPLASSLLTLDALMQHSLKSSFLNAATGSTPSFATAAPSTSTTSLPAPCFTC